MSRFVYAIFALFLVFTIPSGDAVKCYVCNSNYVYACLDPFNSAQMSIMDCDRMNTNSQHYEGQRSVCKKTKQRLNGEIVIERSCAFEEEYGADPCRHDSQRKDYDGYTEHCSVCHYDSCNSAANLAPALYALAASVIGYSVAILRS